MAVTPIAHEAEIVDDGCARRNALILAGAQTLYGMATLTLVAIGGLVGQMLATNKALATLPISTFVIGTACSTIPVSLFMKRVGRRYGFMTGAGFGLAAAVLAVVAIYQQDFWLFCFATFLNGVYQASSQFYRFAAADVASERFRPKAISWVMVGGLFGALLGPQIVIYTRDLLSPVLFAGVFVTNAAIALLAMALLAFVTIPLPKSRPSDAPARPIGLIMAQPKFIVAVVCAMLSFGIMNLVMTATPLAMLACGLTVDDAAWVIQWHAVAMFAPSFFTGSLIKRFGTRPIVATGLLMLAGCGAVALTGLEIETFTIALILLGLGWNFGFIGGTAMVTETYSVAERAKVQGVNDFLVFGTVALASLSSGILLQFFGWATVNLALFPLVTIALVLVAWLALKERREVAA